MSPICLPIFREKEERSVSRTESRPVARAPDDRRQALAEFAEPEMALSMPIRDAEMTLTPQDRNRIQEIRRWIQMVWNEWKAGTESFEDVVDDIRIRDGHTFPILAAGGKKGGCLMNVPTTRSWLAKLGMLHGRPNWENWRSLCPQYRTGQQMQRCDPIFLQEVMAAYLAPGPRKLKPAWRKMCRRWAAEGRSGAATYQQAAYYVRTRVNPREKARAQLTEVKYNNTIRGWINRRNNFAPGECWFSDHRRMDFWIRIPHPESPGEWIAVRPYVTAIQDAATGVFVAVTIYGDQDPNHERILECFETAVVNSGFRLPRVWYTDNGKDFKKQGITLVTLRSARAEANQILAKDGEPLRHGIMNELHIQHKFARPYNGKEKPVERGFGTVGMDFDVNQIGYCGNCPGTRPDYGDTWEGDVMRLPTLETVLVQFNDWVMNEHHVRESDGGQTRVDVFNSRDWGNPIDERELMMGMMLPHAECPIVGRTGPGCGGIRFAGWTYSHIALREHWDKPVMVKTHWRIPKSVEMRGQTRREYPWGVFCFTPDGRFICAAPADRVVDMDAQTPEQKNLLGRMQHIINLAAKLDREGVVRHTGHDRLCNADVALRGLPGRPGAIAITATPGGSRRLAAAGERSETRPQEPPKTRDELEESRAIRAAIEEANGMTSGHPISPVDHPEAIDFSHMEADNGPEDDQRDISFADIDAALTNR